MSNQPNSKDTDCRKDLEQVRHIEGFPIGEPEDICALSDPPHYTAYPNPHLAEFIGQHGTPYDEATDDYQREPFVSDVSEGKNGPIYMAHTYHTKVPYKAILPFIRHYTNPGDIVFDGFCGTGMTGIAAQTLGRKSILCDLSPIATFISKNFNSPVDIKIFQREVDNIIEEVERECGWMYETWHPQADAPNRRKGTINYTVWSEVFRCPYCSAEIIFWNAALDPKTGKVQSKFPCPNCNAMVTKRDLNPVTEQVFVESLGKRIRIDRLEPVSINYSVGTERYDKTPDQHDLTQLQRIQQSTIPYWYPTDRMMHMPDDETVWGDEWRPSRNFVYILELHLKRSRWVMAKLLDCITRLTPPIRDSLLFCFTGILINTSRMYRWRSNLKGGAISGTYYLPSTPQELNVIDAYQRKSSAVKRALRKVSTAASNDGYIISTQSATALTNLGQNSVEYIFTDPPFGDNLMYSELNFLWEAWLRVFTNNRDEAVVNQSQGKELAQYRQLMTQSFSEKYRILKPGRWITVVFHNSKASVWNAIQESLARAGFLVAQVTVLDKKQGSFKQVTAAGAVKNDLVINAYKPRNVFVEQFLQNAGIGQERAFIAEFLDVLPSTADVNRTEKMLYSKMLAYYVQHGYEIGMDSTQFYRVLEDEFVERDGFWFVDETQAQEYEQHKLDRGHTDAGEQAQNVLFITDERSAIIWLHHFLTGTSKSLTDITTAYFKAPRAIDEDEIPELQQLLEETCVQVNGHWKRPDRLTAEELEAKRQERLLRQFEDYLRQARSGQKLSDVRKEAVLAGFTRAYRQKQFQDILAVGRKLDEDLVESSSEIFDFIDIAETKLQV